MAHFLAFQEGCRPAHGTVAGRGSDRVEIIVPFFDFPAEHWIHLKTTNPIESTFAKVRLRTKVTKGPWHEPLAWPWPSSSSRQPSSGGDR